jgi:hypothetical protein
MNLFVLVPLVTLLLNFINKIGCAGVAPNVEPVATQEVAREDFCHQKLQAVGPAVRITIQPSAGGIIDYYGSCGGPTRSQRLSGNL